mgnify:CR=1 FL=1
MQKAFEFWKWLTGRSPSPLAIGIQTANDAMETIVSRGLRRFVSSVEGANKDIDNFKNNIDLLGDTSVGTQLAIGEMFNTGSTSLVGRLDNVTKSVNAIRDSISLLAESLEDTAEQLARIIGMDVAGFIQQANMSTQPVSAAPTMQATTSSIYYNVEVNPTYKNVQSEAGVYWDVTAALGATRR